MEFYRLVLGILGVWRIAHLLSAEDGPWDVLVRLRRRAGSGLWGGLLDCFYCLTLWIAAPFALCLGQGWGERALLWPALSAGAILLERVTSGNHKVPPAPYVEDEDSNHAVLRTKKTTASRD
jgi:hypothetical protein